MNINEEKLIRKAAYSAVAAWMIANGLKPKDSITVTDEHKMFRILADVPEELGKQFDSREKWDKLNFSIDSFFERYNILSKYKFNVYDLSLYECPIHGEQVVEVILYR